MGRAVNFQKQSLNKIEVKLKEFDDRSIIGVLRRFWLWLIFLLWKESVKWTIIFNAQFRDCSEHILLPLHLEIKCLINFR